MSQAFRFDVLKILSDSSAWSERNETALLEPFSHINSIPGKDIRGQMLAAFNAWLKVPDDKLRTITKVVSKLHTASLIIDDIEDDAQLRRGVPAAHKIYGIPQAINSANYVYFQAYQDLFALRTEAQADAQSPESPRRLFKDTQLDKVVTGKSFLRVSSNKLTSDHVPLVNLWGVYFQIRDDYMNLQSSEYESNKGFAEDLTEGKFSFPIVHGVRADTSNRQILNVLQKRPSTPTLKKHTISYLQKHTKSFDYTLSVMASLENQIYEEIARLGGNRGLEEIMKALHVEV
ncbi:hypothetical protein EW026_g3756 [Hermanssonia centrifuga]|uniref:(2E,6E)-farnesyl diphosphate synthase n=1 Tax=Hermanssonia centrifuga TaxID=98765 RepID=A0A4S4KKA6_9APHY|nr:hypothetical protein EW026_g3756 [Hermanssonia centrifuga]